MIESEAHDEADIIWGTVFNDEMDDAVKITVIATGFDTERYAVMPTGGQQTDATQAVGGHYSVRTGFAPPEREEDLNVPTFIRRQAD